MEDDVTPRPNPNTLEERLGKVMREQSSRFTEALTPFLLEMAQALASDKAQFDHYYVALLDKVTDSLSGMTVSCAMNIAQDRAMGKSLAGIILTVQGQKAKKFMADLETGLQSPVKHITYNIHTGQPIPFDFRNHLKPATSKPATSKPDSGRASPDGVGGA